MNPVSNRNPVEWHRLCVELEVAEDFSDIFEDDKREDELSHPLYIEQLLDDDMEAE